MSQLHVLQIFFLGLFICIEIIFPFKTEKKTDYALGSCVEFYVIDGTKPPQFNLMHAFISHIVCCTGFIYIRHFMNIFTCNNGCNHCMVTLHTHSSMHTNEKPAHIEIIIAKISPKSCIISGHTDNCRLYFTFIYAASHIYYVDYHAYRICYRQWLLAHCVHLCSWPHSSKWFRY